MNSAGESRDTDPAPADLLAQRVGTERLPRQGGPRRGRGLQEALLLRPVVVCEQRFDLVGERAIPGAKTLQPGRPVVARLVERFVQVGAEDAPAGTVEAADHRALRMR